MTSKYIIVGMVWIFTFVGLRDLYLSFVKRETKYLYMGLFLVFYSLLVLILKPQFFNIALSDRIRLYLIIFLVIITVWIVHYLSNLLLTDVVLKEFIQISLYIISFVYFITLILSVFKIINPSLFSIINWVGIISVGMIGLIRTIYGYISKKFCCKYETLIFFIFVTSIVLQLVFMNMKSISGDIMFIGVFLFVIYFEWQIHIMPTMKNNLPKLTGEEEIILNKLIENKLYKEIAYSLGISESLVKKRISLLYKKHEVNSKDALIRLYTKVYMKS